MIAEKLILISMALIFIGIILLVVSSIMLSQQQAAQQNQSKSKIDVGFGGFIGPFPFGFFSSRRAFWMWLVTAVLALIVFIVIWLFLRKP